jgi:hypothetical protein
MQIPPDDLKLLVDHGEMTFIAVEISLPDVEIMSAAQEGRITSHIVARPAPRLVACRPHRVVCGETSSEIAMAIYIAACGRRTVPG